MGIGDDELVGGEHPVQTEVELNSNFSHAAPNGPTEDVASWDTYGHEGRKIPMAPNPDGSGDNIELANWDAYGDTGHKKPMAPGSDGQTFENEDSTPIIQVTPTVV